MGRLNGKVIISPRLLMERGDQGKREPPAREKKRPLPQIGTAHTCTCPKHTQPCSHNTINIHIPFYADTPGVPRPPINIPQYLQILLHLLLRTHSVTALPVFCHTLTLQVCILILCLCFCLSLPVLPNLLSYITAGTPGFRRTTTHALFLKYTPCSGPLGTDLCEERRQKSIPRPSDLPRLLQTSRL